MVVGQSSRVKRLALVFVGLVLLIQSGCSGGSSVPTKIYEGGGTIPEIVEQPEAPAKGSAKKPASAPKK